MEAQCKIAASSNELPREHAGARSRATLIVWVACVLGLCLFPLLASEWKSLAQVLVCPVVFIALWRLKLVGERIPRLVFILAVCGVVVGALIRFGNINLSKGAFLVAVASERDLEQERRIYRDRLRRALPPSDRALVGLSRDPVRNGADAGEVLRRHPKIGGVVWGNLKWLVVSFRERDAIAISDVAAEGVAHQRITSGQVPNLRVIMSFRDWGLSHGHTDATTRYITSLIVLWRHFASYEENGGFSEDQQARLRGIESMRARWSSRAHLAVSAWLLGTSDLLESIKEAHLDQPKLDRACEAFQRASERLRPRDNPSLSVAIRNNYAVALFLRAHSGPEGKGLRKAAFKKLAAAARLEKSSGANGVVAGLNNRRAIEWKKSRVGGEK